LPEEPLDGLEDDDEPEDGLDGLEGLVERFCWLELEPEPMLLLPLEPGEAVLPPDAPWLSRLHPERSAPESANDTAATTAVTFMLTSVGWGKRQGAIYGPGDHQDHSLYGP
jgi:hypothetical protein